MKFISCFAVIAVALYATAVANKFNFIDMKFIQHLKSVRAGSGEFTPAQFPCGYTVYYDMDTNTRGQVLSASGYQAGYGRYIAATSKAKVNETEGTMYSILRVDIKENGHPDSAASIFAMEADYQGMHVKQCSFDEYIDPYYDGYDTVSPVNYILNTTYPYDTKKDNVKYNGQTCTLYSFTETTTSTSMEIYANSANYIIGFKMTMDTDGEQNSVSVSFSYNMQAYEPQFKLDRSFTGCEEFAAIYSSPPKEPNCPINPNPPPASASFAKPVQMIIAIILLALISLF